MKVKRKEEWATVISEAGAIDMALGRHHTKRENKKLPGHHIPDAEKSTQELLSCVGPLKGKVGKKRNLSYLVSKNAWFLSLKLGHDQSGPPSCMGRH